MSTEEARGTTVAPEPPPTGQEQTPPTGAASETRQAESDLAKELRELGRQMEAVLRAARSDPRTREVETQVASAMKDAERQFNEALNTLRREMQAGRLKETIKGTAATAAEQVEAGLAKGLHVLNERLARAVKDTENPSQKAEGTTPPAGANTQPGGTEETLVTERFGNNPPAIQNEFTPPSAPVPGSGEGAPSEKPGPQAEGTSETLITERFDDKPPTL